MPGASETARSALRRIERFARRKGDGWSLKYNELGYAVASRDSNRLARIEVHYGHLHFPAIPAVDKPRSVRNCKPVLRSKTAARKNEPCVAVRNGKSETRRN